MSFGESVGIVTTTLDRPDFIERFLHYLKSVGFKGSFHLGDSCNDVDRARIAAAVESIGGAYEIQIVECRGLTVRDSLHAASISCSRPYATYLGDDDYCLMPALDICTDFLAANPDYAAAHGEGYSFTLDRPGPYGVVEQFVTYPMPSLEQESPVDRLRILLRHYGVTLFSVMKTSTFQNAFTPIADIPDPTFRDELIPCCSIAIEGKVKNLPVPHVMRQAHKRRYVHPTVDYWVRSEHFSRSARMFEIQMASRLAALVASPREELEKIAWNAMAVYITRHMGQQLLQISLNTPEDPRGYDLDPKSFMAEGGQYSPVFIDIIRTLKQPDSAAT